MMIKRLKDTIKVFLGRSIAVTPVKEKTIKSITPYSCNVCGQSNISFNPLPMHYLYYLDKYQFIHNIFYGETLDMVNYLCNNCEASDRDRLSALYIDEIKNHYTDEIKILDIAPYKPFSLYLNKIDKFKVRTADLYQKGVDDIVDIMDMKLYDSESFDAFICSHVLEHIENDIKGMQELYRILKKGGWGIAMVPINLQLEEDYITSDAVTEADKWKHYGHPDHHIMYSKNGFVKKLQSVGFEVLQLDINYFGEQVFKKYGIHERSVLYVVKK